MSRHPAASTLVRGCCWSFRGEVDKARVYRPVEVSADEHREVPVIPGPSLSHVSLKNSLGPVVSEEARPLRFRGMNINRGCLGT